MTPTAITPGDVTAALLSVGVRPGSVVLVHPDAIVAAQFHQENDNDDQRLELLIDAIESAIGQDGTLVIPTFTYSFTKCEPFNVATTPSAVGMVGEIFRMRPGVRRTSDPIFSLGCKGPRAEELCAIPIKECFGAESAFAALHRMNAHVVFLGCSIGRATLVHYVETIHGVDYRYEKEFSGTIIAPDGQKKDSSIVYNVRDLNRKSAGDLRRLQERLADEGKLRTVRVGRSRISAITANDLFDTAWKMLDEDPVSLIEEGALA